MSKGDPNHSKTNTKSQQTLNNLLDKPIISIKEARKLLGANYNDKSDTQISEIICLMRMMAEAMLKMVASSTKQNGDIIKEGNTK